MALLSRVIADPRGYVTVQLTHALKMRKAASLVREKGGNELLEGPPHSFLAVALPLHPSTKRAKVSNSGGALPQVPRRGSSILLFQIHGATPPYRGTPWL